MLVRRLLAWYDAHGRHELPWRTKRDPYYTLVSEFMLQQTQVDRVVPKFEAFVRLFPNVAALAAASVADVLRAWRGLGYNSRAVRLKRVAEAIAQRGGEIPSETEALLALPGIGAYTAAAIRTFGFDLAGAPVDTNVRRILHRLLAGVEHPPTLSERELTERAIALVPAERAHDWSSALMDLGSTFCTARTPKCLLCPLREDCSAAPIDAAALERSRGELSRRKRELPFEQTARFARGRIVDRLRDLPAGEAISLLDLHRSLEPVLTGRTLDDVSRLVDGLARDGVIARAGDAVALAE